MNMKTMKGFLIPTFALVLFAGCWNDTFAPPSTPPPEGFGSLILRLNGYEPARTIVPQDEDYDFDLDNIVMTFTPTPSGTPFKRAWINSATPIELPVGTYELVVTAYATYTINDEPAAISAPQSITIGGGTVTTAIVTLSLIVADGEGRFSWDINLSDFNLTTAQLVITDLNGVQVDDSPIDISSDPAGVQQIHFCILPVGFYRVTFELVNDEGQKAVRKEILHIYKNMESYFEWTLSAQNFFGAPGSADNPFIVYDEETLRKVGAETTAGGWTLDAHYEQIANITLNNDWAPIGTFLDPFTGSYDGGEKTISGLSITGADNYHGLFSFIDTDGVVANVRLDTINISGSSIAYAGGVVGRNDGKVQNCSVNNGQISGWASLGGVVGANFGTVENCYSTATILGAGDAIGGVVGDNSSTLQNCYSTGSVKGANKTGGVAGNNSGTVENCYSTGAVSADGNNAGGIVGINEGAVQNCVALGPSVNGASNVGRVAGNSTATLTTNFGRDEMVLTGGTVTVGAGLKDGADVTKDSWESYTFWLATVIDNSATTPWKYNSADILPTLNNVGGVQEPVVQPIPASPVTVSNGTTTTGYPNLKAALDSITTAGTYTVTVLADQKFDSYTLTTGKDITLTTPPGANITFTTTISEDVAFIIQGCTLTLSPGSGGNITLDGQGTGESAVVLEDDGRFVMEGGTLTGFTDSAVKVNTLCTFDMRGGEINGNSTTQSGGGVYVGGAFTMSGGTISGNTAVSNGGGVYADGSTFEMTGGEISGNTVSGPASSGGGVYVGGGAEFTMSGGEISGNTSNGTVGGAGSGGGVSVGGTFTMTGGTIQNNTASGSGGGGGVSVNSSSAGPFTLGGTAVIKDNKGNDSSDNNVRLISGTYIILGTGAAAPASDMEVWVQTVDANGVIVQSGATDAVVPYFNADEAGKEVARYGNQLVVQPIPASVLDSLAKIQAYLAAQPGGDSPDDPITLPLAITTTANTYSDLLNTINAVEKYVDLDFSDCDGPESFSLIGSYDIDERKNWITKIIIPDGVTRIGSWAVSSCTNLTSVTIPNSVTIIYGRSFLSCTSLTEITIPASVTEIWANAFSDCTSLCSVTFEGTIAAEGFDPAVSGSPEFDGDLQAKYLAPDGGPGTYTRDPGGTVWTKQQ